MQQLLLCILEDMREPLIYLPQGAVLGVAGAVVWLLVGPGRNGVNGRRGVTKKMLLDGLAFGMSVTYATVLIQYAFLSRPPGSRTGVNLGLFDTWGSSVQSKAYVLENVIMFIPFGILLPVWLRPLRRFWLCIPAGIACSVTLEFVQWMTQRGHCQLDDVVMNGLGVLLGWIVAYMFRPRRKRQDRTR